MGARAEKDRPERGQHLGSSAHAGHVVLDVRPVAEYMAGHIPGAMSVPPDEVAARLRRLEDGFPEWRKAQLPVAVGAEPNRP